MFESKLEQTCSQQIKFSNSSLNEYCYVLQVGDKPSTEVGLCVQVENPVDPSRLKGACLVSTLEVMK